MLNEAPRLSELYQEHRRRALAIALRILGNAQDAEDVVQDVFSRLCSSPAEFQGRAAYSTWLHRIMVNSSINWLRARRRRSKLTCLPEPSLGPEVLVAGRELETYLLAALEVLPERQRQLLVLRELRGLSYPEIAALLGIPEGTIKSGLHRGRCRLIEELTEQGVCEELELFREAG